MCLMLNVCVTVYIRILMFLILIRDTKKTKNSWNKWNNKLNVSADRQVLRIELIWHTLGLFTIVLIILNLYIVNYYCILPLVKTFILILLIINIINSSLSIYNKKSFCVNTTKYIVSKIYSESNVKILYFKDKDLNESYFSFA